jgi:hypothetical protein
MTAPAEGACARYISGQFNKQFKTVINDRKKSSWPTLKIVISGALPFYQLAILSTISPII